MLQQPPPAAGYSQLGGRAPDPKWRFLQHAPLVRCPPPRPGAVPERSSSLLSSADLLFRHPLSRGGTCKEYNREYEGADEVLPFGHAQMRGTEAKRSTRHKSPPIRSKKRACVLGFRNPEVTMLVDVDPTTARWIQKSLSRARRKKNWDSILQKDEYWQPAVFAALVHEFDRDLLCSENEKAVVVGNLLPQLAERIRPNLCEGAARRGADLLRFGPSQSLVQFPGSRAKWIKPGMPTQRRSQKQRRVFIRGQNLSFAAGTGSICYSWANPKQLIRYRRPWSWPPTWTRRPKP